MGFPETHPIVFIKVPYTGAGPWVILPIRKPPGGVTTDPRPVFHKKGALKRWRGVFPAALASHERSYEVSWKISHNATMRRLIEIDEWRVVLIRVRLVSVRSVTNPPDVILSIPPRGIESIHRWTIPYAVLHAPNHRLSR